MDRSIIKNILDFLFVLTLLSIGIKDFKDKIIPDFFNFILLGLGTLKIFLLNNDFEKSIIGMGVYPLILIFIYGYVSEIVKKDVVGFGDIKLLGAVGFYNGYSGLYDMLILHNIIFTAGLIIILPFYIFKKEIRNKEIPFAPFIVLGVLIFNFAGDFL